MWQRWNGTTKIFEKSTDNGQNWTALDLDAAILTQGALAKARQHAQTAYLDASNVFSAVNNQFQEILKVDKGLTFPATQVASAGANTLDDYEEGTWTPVIQGSVSNSGQTYSLQVGKYIKIGSLVYIQGRLTLSALGTVTGNLELGGLPFTVSSGANDYSTLNISLSLNLGTAVVSLLAAIFPNTTKATFYHRTAAATGISVSVQAIFANTTDIIFSGHYIAAN